jgi:hypothetical protein
MPFTAFAYNIPLPQLRPSPLSLRRSRVPHCGASPPSAAPTRRALLHGLVVAAFAAAVPPLPSLATDAAREGVEAVAMCQHVLGPVRRYVDTGAWDRARTSVNYCTRVLAVRKKMLAGADALSADEAYLTAMEAAAEVPNLFTSLDAAVYTAVFIPAEDGVSLEQREYQQAAYRALGEATGYLDAYLAVFDKDLVAAAKAMAKTAKYEIRVDDP